MPARATLHKIHLVLNRLREATHAARSIIMQGWNGPLGCYLHLSVFPATSNLLMIIKEQRGPAALWKQAPIQPGVALHPQSSWIKSRCLTKKKKKEKKEKTQEKLAGRLPRTTCKPPATPGRGGYSKYSKQARCDINNTVCAAGPAQTQATKTTLTEKKNQIKWIQQQPRREDPSLLNSLQILYQNTVCELIIRVHVTSIQIHIYAHDTICIYTDNDKGKQHDKFVAERERRSDFRWNGTKLVFSCH